MAEQQERRLVAWWGSGGSGRGPAVVDQEVRRLITEPPDAEVAGLISVAFGGAP